MIRGETDHYHYVCSSAATGIATVGLQSGVPCTFGVLTVDTLAQALDRITGGAKRDSGAHAAQAALAALAVKRELAEPAVGRSGRPGPGLRLPPGSRPPPPPPLP